MASSSQNKDSKASTGSDQGMNTGTKSSSGGSKTDTSNRGFASMDPAQQREIAAEGGRAAHASGNAHEFTSEEAKKAGSKSHDNDSAKASSGSKDSHSGSGSGSASRSGGTKGSDASDSSKGSSSTKGSDSSDSGKGSGSGSRSK